MPIARDLITIPLLLSALVIPVHAQPKTINVRKDQRFAFAVYVTSSVDGRVYDDGSMSGMVDPKRRYGSSLGGTFVLAAQAVHDGGSDWRHTIEGATDSLDGNEYLSSALVQMPEPGGISVSDGGVITRPTRYDGNWGEHFVRVLAFLGISERHFSQFFFLQSGLAQHHAGEVWERRRDDTSTNGNRRIEQHYTVRFSHEGAVDTLGMKTIRLRFEFAVDSIIQTSREVLPMSGEYGFLLVDTLRKDGAPTMEMVEIEQVAAGGVIRGVVYYNVADGLVTAFSTTHALTLRYGRTTFDRRPDDPPIPDDVRPRMTGQGGAKGTISIVRK